MWIDIAWASLAVFGIWKGWTQGLIISIFTAIAWGIGILGAIKLCTAASQFIQDKFDIHSQYLPVISFLAVFAIIALVIFMIGKSLEKVVEIAQLGFLNKLGGVILRVTIYTLLFSIFIWLMNEAGFISAPVKKQSKTYAFLDKASDYLINHISEYTPYVKKLFSELQEFLDKISGAGKG
jgi:membrane protein required for colicin V production